MIKPLKFSLSWGSGRHIASIIGIASVFSLLGPTMTKGKDGTRSIFSVLNSDVGVEKIPWKEKTASFTLQGTRSSKGDTHWNGSVHRSNSAAILSASQKIFWCVTNYNYTEIHYENTHHMLIDVFIISINIRDLSQSFVISIPNTTCLFSSLYSPFKEE